jgi:nitrogen regulatory protein PII-like uncharacterized protein
MTIKKVAEAVGVQASFVFNHHSVNGSSTQNCYTEYDIEKMLRYVAMAAANKAISVGVVEGMEEEAAQEIVDQILG